jgi:O-antigen ligase
LTKIVNIFLRQAAFTVSILAFMAGLFYFASHQPGYFTNQTYLGGVIILELIIVTVWWYDRLFFPAVMLAFLLAGLDLPFTTAWNALRWIFLAIGAFIGVFATIRTHGLRYGAFHLVAFFAALCAGVSAAFSAYPFVAAEKALSLFLLFLYASTGVRLAVRTRQLQFFRGLLTACEIFVGILATLYAAGLQVMGNLNSLGAVMGVVGAPILAWGILVEDNGRAKRRRLVFYTICMLLVFYSQARAGWAAAVISSGLLCIALRKYKPLAIGAIVIIVFIGSVGIMAPDFLSSTTKSAIYKQSDEAHGLFASRLSPWHTAIDDITQHPWFGMGLGTTVSENDSEVAQGLFASSAQVTAEFGSSYLAIVAGLGLLGSIPSLLLLLLLLRRVLHTVKWLRAFRIPAHPATPLALVVVAALVHAAFEDWMFACGNYLCVFFWSLAFVFVDLAPQSPKLFMARNDSTDVSFGFASHQ